MSPSTLSLLDFQTSFAGIQPIVQRKANSIVGDVPVLFTYTGSNPDKIQGRVMQGATVVKDWTYLTSLITIAGTGSGLLQNVQQGMGYTLQIRDAILPNNAPTNSNGTVLFGIGAIFLAMGQSNMRNSFESSYTYTVPTTALDEYTYYLNGNVKGCFFDEAGWHSSSNGSNGATGTIGGGTASGGHLMFVRIISKQLENKYGYPVPVALMNYTANANGIESFSPSGWVWNAVFNNSGSTIGTIGLSSPKNICNGDIEGFIYHQGEANQSDSSATYQSKLQVLYQAMLDKVAAYGRDGDSFLFAPAVIGSYGIASCPSVENIRAAQSNFVSANSANSGVMTGWTTIDLSTSLDGGDGLHFKTDARKRRSLRRAIQSILKFTGCATFSGCGGRINTTPSRNGNVVTLSIIHEGGTAISTPNLSNPPTGFYCNTSPDFSGTYLFPTVSLINGNTQVQLTFAGGTNYPLYIKYLGGQIGSTTVDGDGFTASCNPNTTNCLYDNVSYPTGVVGTDIEERGLPILPTVGSIIVN